jgi:hypothetical protein
MLFILDKVQSYEGFDKITANEQGFVQVGK